MTDIDKMYDEANALKSQGDLPGAAARLDEILKIDPNHSLTHQALSVILQRMGEKERAIFHAKKVVEISPNDHMAYTHLSVISQRCGLIQPAEDAMARAHELRGSSPRH